MGSLEDALGKVKPLLSVVIPTCHRNDLLALCLDRLAPGIQKLSPDFYEVIVTDDGSRSTAEDMIRERYPWARWVAGPRMGPAANRNHGAMHVTGDWVVFTDDDCLPEPGWLAGYLSAIAPGVEAYEGRTTCKEGIRTPLYDAPINETGGCFWSCNIMMAKRLFHRMDGFNTSFRLAADEDTDLRERLKREGLPILFAIGAVVDHPPQACRQGIKAGKFREAQVQLWHLSGQKISMRRVLARRVIAESVRRLRAYPINADSLRVAIALFPELLYVLFHLSKWEDRYRNLYRDKVPPYPYPYL